MASLRCFVSNVCVTIALAGEHECVVVVKKRGVKIAVQQQLIEGVADDCWCFAFRSN